MFGAWCALPEETWERKMCLLSHTLYNRKKIKYNFSVCETDVQKTPSSTLHHPFPLPSSLQNQFLRFFFRLRHIQQQQLRPCQRPETWDWSGFCCLARNQKTHFRESCPTFVILTNKFASHGRCRSWDIAIEITYPTSSPLDLIFVHGGWLLHQDSFDTLFATIMAESDHVQNLYALFKGSCWKNWSSRRDCRVELAILVRCFLSLLRWFLEVVRAYLPYFFYTWVSPCW